MTERGYVDPDYVDVAERIRLFYERYPDGRIRSVEQGVLTFDSEGRVVSDGQTSELRPTAYKSFVYVIAEAWRTADDAKPARGRAWEPIPGPTPFTRDSELMNAETAAWGRAIVAAGIPSKKIASADEVQARKEPEAEWDTSGPGSAPRTKAQNSKLHVLLGELEAKGPPPDHDTWKDWAHAWMVKHFGKHSSKDLTIAECEKLIDELEAFTVPFG